tara:strand:+ start:6335 stop:6520 length:186 start_codon:yes stop_codon:yes gene_type:complete
MFDFHLNKNKKVDIVIDQNKTDIHIIARAVFAFFSKKRAAKNEPTGIEIKMGEKIAIPNSP